MIDRHIGKIGILERDAFENKLPLEPFRANDQNYLKKRNLNQKDLGKLPGVDKAKSLNMKNNTGNVTITTLTKIPEHSKQR